MLKDVSWLAVLLALVATQTLGFLWYGPWFGDEWMAILGKTEADFDQSSAATLMTAGMIFNLIWILGIAGSMKLHFNSPFIERIMKALPFLSRLGFYRRTATGKLNAFLLWLLVALPVQSTQFTYAGQPVGLIPIDIGYTFFAFPIAGAIIGFFSKIPEPASNV